MRLPKEHTFLILIQLQIVFGIFMNSHRIPDHRQGEFKFLVNFGNLTCGENTYIILRCFNTFDDDDDFITKALVDGLLKYQSLL